MSRLDAAPDYALLARLLRHPDDLTRLSPQEFSRSLDAAQQARLLGWLMAEAEARHAPVDPPSWLQDRVVSGRAVVREYERAIWWEIDRLDRALGRSGVPWILLKGAGYIAARLPPGRGRRVADIDLLVPEAAVPTIESLLVEHGWTFGELDAYDERYYREWMHELPPMVHQERKSVVDVHHAILPRTSRLKPESQRLFARAVTVPVSDAHPEFAARVLCPSHMVLHAAAHLFHDGEIAGAIRDLADLDQLLRTFGTSEGFWPDLLQEAAALDLTRPTFYALRYAAAWFDTPVPADVAASTAAWAPAPAVVRIMDGLVRRSIPGGHREASPAAALALYVRSHWLRMPPLMVVRHLAKKATK